VKKRSLLILIRRIQTETRMPWYRLKSSTRRRSVAARLWAAVVERGQGEPHVAAGSKDEHTTLEESHGLFDAALAPKSLWIVAGARHQDLLAYDKPGCEEHMVGFLRRALLNSTEKASDANTH
jgi:fermentation-respiration switch protein FrsA (DUF1100 family)